ncbi:20983_t:CDS:2, partial [Gigaspora rosea]
SSDDDSDDSEFDTSDLTNDSSQIIKSIHHTIYNSLFDYWNKPLMAITIFVAIVYTPQFLVCQLQATLLPIL